MAIANYTSQGNINWGGALTWNPTTALPYTVTIPLFLKESDIPVRQPKITEVNTIPIPDEAGWSDGVTQAVFYGAAEPLQTEMTGYLLTPLITVTDSVTHLKYMQLNPTTNGLTTGTSLGLQGFSYADLIWAYLEGKINPVGTAYYQRVDPASYTDTYGNVYTSVGITAFTSTQQVAIGMQNFSMTLALEL